MAHFARLDENNKVVQVIKTCDDDETTFAERMLAEKNEKWVQTSYNTRGGVHLDGGVPLRKNYAGITYTYDASRDAFIPSKTHQSWILNEETCLWEAPIPMPEDSDLGSWRWNEETLSWVI